MSKKRDTREIILQALENSPRRWRTATGLAKDTGIPVKEVSRFLEQSPEIVRSRKAGSHGKPLFARTEKRSETGSADPSEEKLLSSEAGSERQDSLKYLALLPLDASMNRLRDTIGRAIRDEHSQAIFLTELLPGAAWVDQIVQLIRNCDVVIADVTRNNPNVMFELGIAHGLDKPLILLLSEASDANLPSDLAGYQFLSYDPQNLSAFAERLRRTTRHLNTRRGGT